MDKLIAEVREATLKWNAMSLEEQTAAARGGDHSTPGPIREGWGLPVLGAPFSTWASFVLGPPIGPFAAWAQCVPR